MPLKVQDAAADKLRKKRKDAKLRKKAKTWRRKRR